MRERMKYRRYSIKPPCSESKEDKTEQKRKNKLEKGTHQLTSRIHKSGNSVEKKYPKDPKITQITKRQINYLQNPHSNFHISIK